MHVPNQDWVSVGRISVKTFFPLISKPTFKLTESRLLRARHYNIRVIKRFQIGKTGVRVSISLEFPLDTYLTRARFDMRAFDKIYLSVHIINRVKAAKTLVQSYLKYIFVIALKCK